MISQSCTSILGRIVIVSCLLVSGTVERVTVAQTSDPHPNPVLDWNQAFIDTLVATATRNAASQRLGAIVHTSIFDAYNGIERRYTHVLVPPDDANGQRLVPNGASRRAAIIAAAYTALTGLFPSRITQLTDLYTASLAALSDDGEDGGQSREFGIVWGTYVANTVLALRANDGYNGSYSFTGGTAVGQWRPIAPDTAMTGLQLAYTVPFVVDSDTQFQPEPPRPFGPVYVDDFKAVMALGAKTGSSRTEEQTKLAPFWEGNASVHWNQAANQIARAHNLSISDSNRVLAALNLAMADTAFTVWRAKLDFGSNAGYLTWRPFTAITLADTDPLAETIKDTTWLPLVAPTPSHPEYPAGHPAQNGAAATILLRHFSDAQVFTLTTGTLPSVTYSSISQARADGNAARVWGGMHYPSTVRASDALGAAIANYVNSHSMQPFRRE